MKNKYIIRQDKDGWYRICKNGRAIRSRKGNWNLYINILAAQNGLRRIQKKGELK